MKDHFSIYPLVISRLLSKKVLANNGAIDLDIANKPKYFKLNVEAY